jgi:hypothetical protein
MKFWDEWWINSYSGSKALKNTFLTFELLNSFSDTIINVEKVSQQYFPIRQKISELDPKYPKFNFLTKPWTQSN